jgi:hypothetical protein
LSLKILGDRDSQPSESFGGLLKMQIMALSPDFLVQKLQGGSWEFLPRFTVVADAVV